VKGNRTVDSIFFEKEIQLAIPIKSVIISEISMIKRRKSKNTAKKISRYKSRQIWE